MLKRALRTFYMGLFAAGLLGVLRYYFSGSISGSQAVTTILVASIVLVVLALLTIWAATNMPFVRRIIMGRPAAYEGLWATDLREDGTRKHGSLRCSLAEIQYDKESDELLYRGVPFQLDRTPVTGWRSQGIFFDKRNREFIFSSIGTAVANNNQRRGKFTLNPVSSFGRLKVDINSRNEIIGEVVDLGATVSTSEDNQSKHVDVFDLHLYRVTKQDLRAALGSNKRPVTNEEKLDVTIATLKRYKPNWSY